MPQFKLPDGAELHYEEHGEGRPILFLHGVWMSGRFFQKQLPALGKTHRAIALDFRGHGRSSHIHTGHTMGQYARDVHAFIQGMGLKDVVLAGWSMGTFVLLDYFAQFGAEHLAAAIVVEESTSDYKWPDWPIGFIDFAGLCQMMKDVQTDRDAFVRAFIPLMFKNPPSDADTKWMFEEITRLPESIAACILFDQTVQDYRPALPRVTVPTLLCFGRDEKLIPVAAGEYLRDHIKGSKLVVFEESSHCPFLEEPERFNAEVEKFVGQLGR
jgi:pimeloyl-ACP methyl ester carboxylesterase